MSIQLSRRAALASLLTATASLATAALIAPAQADAPGSFQGRSRPRPRTGGLKAELTPGDRAINRKCINKTLNEAPTGKPYTWRNPETGNGGTVTPTSKPQRHNGEVCRSFKETITLKDGRTETINSRACKQADGSWSIA
jgi:surface antigen